MHDYIGDSQRFRQDCTIPSLHTKIKLLILACTLMLLVSKMEKKTLWSCGLFESNRIKKWSKLLFVYTEMILHKDHFHAPF